MNASGDAVLDCLRSEARRRKLSTDFILSRYVAERFLYRVSRSRHAERLTLKGAFLFAAWEGDLLRSTSDIDLHAAEEDAPAAEAMVREIASSELQPSDGVEFNMSGFVAVPILGTRRPGRRIAFDAKVGSARVRLRIDMGFGQPIRPGPEVRQYPSLMPACPSFPLRTYPRESVVGEKLAIAVEYGRDNTRLRDYWDLWFISTRYRFVGHVLADAVAATFADRDAGSFILRRDGYWEGAFARDFVERWSRRAWTEWLARHAPVAGRPAFPEAVAAVSRFAIPVLHAVRDGEPLRSRWSSRNGWSALGRSKRPSHITVDNSTESV